MFLCALASAKATAPREQFNLDLTSWNEMGDIIMKNVNKQKEIHKDVV